MLWKKRSKDEIRERVFRALDENRNYDSDYILGIPGSYLDTQQFYRDADFLKNAPYLQTLINNPNHIGCHTLTDDKGEDLFRGTQKLEIELIRMVSEEIMQAEPRSVDGYVAPGGTEANIQALWIYRNYYKKQFRAKNHEIGVVFSTDSHYSFYKGANLLSIEALPVKVDEDTRRINPEALRQRLHDASIQGIKYLIVIANMSTTMFGSVDDPNELAGVFKEKGLPYKMHADGAFGGFIYPFTTEKNHLDFSNPEITSITLDAHKMLMAPYGTGIFLIRKGWMPFAATEEAQYVQGLDYTLCGSRNGAQAISIWMILQTYGPEGWRANMAGLMEETDRLCAALDDMDMPYFRNPDMNIVTLKAGHFPEEVSRKYRLVADTYEGKAQWWKIVVMPHTKGAVIDAFLEEVRASKY
ncbi:MAG TPA: aspartate aminotransferase family protein [Cryomorphaceae bacterium]|nr:aspartate aminotransferase family protein [Cryomorphaceae bacterium]